METNQLKNEIERLINEIGSEFDLINGNADNSNADQLIQKIEQLYKKSVIFDFLIKENKSRPAVPIESPEITNEITPGTIEQNNPDEKNTLVDTKQAVLDLFSDNQFGASPPEIALPENVPPKNVVDIRTVIGINEKFRYINELFDGSLQEYNIVINQVNTIYTMSAVQAYLDSLKSIYHWDNESSTVESFFELVLKRFQ